MISGKVQKYNPLLQRPWMKCGNDTISFAESQVWKVSCDLVDHRQTMFVSRSTSPTVTQANITPTFRSRVCASKQILKYMWNIHSREMLLWNLRGLYRSIGVRQTPTQKGISVVISGIKGIRQPVSLWYDNPTFPNWQRGAARCAGRDAQ